MFHTRAVVLALVAGCVCAGCWDLVFSHCTRGERICQGPQVMHCEDPVVGLQSAHWCGTGQQCLNGGCVTVGQAPSTNPDPWVGFDAGSSPTDTNPPWTQPAKPKHSPPCDGSCESAQVCDVNANGGDGKCIAPRCPIPKQWPEIVQRFTLFHIMDADKGCDLNDDATPDNALGTLKDLAGPQLADAIKSEAMVWLMQPPSLEASTAPIRVDMMPATPQASGGLCDGGSHACTYVVKRDSWDQTISAQVCPLRSSFPGVEVTGEFLTAGLGNGTFILELPVTPGIVMRLPLRLATMRGRMVGPGGWQSTRQGTICGVITAYGMAHALDGIPEETLKDIGGLAAVQALLNSLLMPDIDTDGDGEADGISVALEFEAEPAVIGAIQGL